MKSILISIRPEWVAKILNGEKTIEIRKTMPKCELPCKVYICETESGGKVVAEFTLNKITKHEKNYIDIEDNLCYNFSSADVKKAGFTFDDKNAIASIFALCQFDLFVEGYGRGKPLYAWHIEDLKIYDKPKELSNFKVYDKTYDSVGAFNWVFSEEQKYILLKRPPQSWCYVEELK